MSHNSNRKNITTKNKEGKEKRLTSKQQKFLEGLIAGLSAVDSYRNAYVTENMSERAVRVESSRLKNHPIITLHLDRHSAAVDTQLRRNTLSSRGWIVSRLEQEATDSESPAASRISALALLGKVAGVDLFTEREKDEDRSRMSEAELHNTLEQRLASYFPEHERNVVDITPEKSDDDKVH